MAFYRYHDDGNKVYDDRLIKNVGRRFDAIRVCGVIQHQISNAQPNCIRNASYSQFYIYDPSEANDERLKSPLNSHLSRELLDLLDSFIRKNNNYAQQYQMLRELYEENPDENYAIVFRKKANAPDKTFDLPTTQEIAGVYRYDEIPND